MNLFVIRYKETEDGPTIRTENFRKEDHVKKLNDLSQKGCIIVDVFDADPFNGKEIKR